ncbi:hypothetical protein CIP107546_00633 [Corynebacterium diphtheriae]|nr:hypothetical protein CIP107546_00633 [Corynebacterium diphtheriae]
MGLWWCETLCVFHATTTPLFFACVGAHACVFVWGVPGGVCPCFFMPTLRGAVGCLWCSRIRDYVNPWSGLRCGCGGAGVFVITDSWSWFRAEGFQTHENTPTTTPRPKTHLGACPISSCSRIRDYVNPWSVPGCGCGGAGVFRDHGFVLKDSRHENTPVRGSINSCAVLFRSSSWRR